MGRGGQGGCERRIEVFVKIQKKNIFLFFWGGEGGGVGLGGQCGCERRIEVFVKIYKKNGGVRVDVNGELKFLVKKKLGGPGGGRVWGGGRMDGCERRIEVFVKIQKKNFWGGEGGGVGFWGGGSVWM